MSKVRNNFAWEIVLIACNLRLAIIILTPLIDKIVETFKLSTVQLGILTTIPLLCFGFISILISLLIKKIGTRRTIIIGLFLLMLANFFRIYTESLIFVGTLFVGVAITILNVTLPALVVDYAEEKSAFLNGSFPWFILGFVLGISTPEPALLPPWYAKHIGTKAVFSIYCFSFIPISQ